MARIASTTVQLTSMIKGGRDMMPAGSVIAGHSFQHAYGHAFFVILPSIYASLGLSPLAAGLIGTIRQMSSGVATMGGGVLVDRIQHRRLMILYLSLVATGVAYFLVGLAPTFVLILVAVGLAGIAGSVWHPTAISLLSQRYPGRRGLMVGVHRSSGSVGDFVGPLAAGGLLLVLAWQRVFFLALPLALVVLVWTVLATARSQSWQELVSRSRVNRPLGQQLRALGVVARQRRLLLLMLVSGVAGLGQGGILMWLPIYLSETQGMGSLGIGFHISLLSGMGIISAPLMGGLSDRLGRKGVIMLVLTGKGTVAVLMALAGGGILFSILVAVLGIFMMGVNSLVQAAALDMAEGQQLEGSLIGLLWGNNALFSGASPLLVGAVVASLGFTFIFWYVAAMNVLGFLLVLSVPDLGRGGRRVAAG